MDSLTGKHIVITGASSGIGESIAREAAKIGAHLVLAARNEQKLLELQEELKVFNVNVICIPTDVIQKDQCKHLIEQAIAQLGSINVLINNAGITMRASFENVDDQVLHRVMNVNYWGTAYCSKYALPELIKNKGSLVAVSSVTGLKGLPGRSAYAASKFAINGLFESIRMENMHLGLHTLIACPGYTSSKIRNNSLTADGTPQVDTPAYEGNPDDPQEVAQQILQAIRDRKDFMLNNTEGKKIFWLNKFFPRFLEKKIHQVISQEPNSPIRK